MANIKHVNSIVDREFRNRINQLIDATNAQGKTIQDLVAEGQLTPEQYGQLLTTLNGLIKSGQVDEVDLSPELRSEVEKIRNKIDKGDVSVYDINKNKGKFDQTYLTQDLIDAISGAPGANILSEVADKSVTSIKIADGAITPNHISPPRLVVGKNKFDKSDIYYDRLINYNGELAEVVGFVSSAFIPAKGNTTYTATYRRVVAFYDAAKNFISHISDVQMNFNGVPFTTPENTEYMRVSIRDTQINTMQIEEGDKETPYEEYTTEAVYEHKFPPLNNSVGLEALKSEVLDLINSGGSGEAPYAPKMNYTWRDDLEGLLFSRGDEMYFVQDHTKLLKSTDGGKTKTLLRDFTPNRPVMVWKHTTDITKDYTLVFVGPDNKATSTKDLFRSDDNDSTFTKVLSDIIAPYNAWSSISGAQGTSIVVFADYVSTGDSHIYSSEDDGQTWRTTFSTSDVRHFHNVSYNKSESAFYVSGGDSNPQVKWYKSTTYNPSTDSHWIDISLPEMTQEHRTTHFEFISPDYVLYGSDALPPYYSGIFKVNLNNLTDIEKIMPLNNESTTFYRAGELIIIGTYSSTYQTIKEGSLYVSVDGGKTFTKDFNYPVEAGLDIGGAYHIMGENGSGSVFVRFWGAEGKTSFAILEASRV